MPTAPRSLLAAAAVTALVVGAGVALSAPEDDEPDAPPPVTSVALGELDTATLAVARAGFCDAVASEQVAAALGGEAVAGASYDNGDRVRLAPGTTDVAHEFGCTWTAADGGEARGWVFAPPVPAERATRLARSAARSEGCERLPGAAAFGRVTVAVQCADASTRTVSFRGLFGDAWLSCSLSGPVAADPVGLAERADRWCATVVIAGTSPAVAG